MLLRHSLQALFIFIFAIILLSLISFSIPKFRKYGQKVSVNIAKDKK